MLFRSYIHPQKVTCGLSQYNPQFSRKAGSGVRFRIENLRWVSAMSCRSAVGRRGQTGAERESRSPTFEFVREIAAGRNPFPFGNGSLPFSNSTVPVAAGWMPFGGGSFLTGNDSIPVSGGMVPVGGVLFPITGISFLMGCGWIPAGSVSFATAQDYFRDAFGRHLNGGVAKGCDSRRGWHG